MEVGDGSSHLSNTFKDNMIGLIFGYLIVDGQKYQERENGLGLHFFLIFLSRGTFGRGMSGAEDLLRVEVAGALTGDRVMRLDLANGSSGMTN